MEHELESATLVCLMSVKSDMSNVGDPAVTEINEVTLRHRLRDKLPQVKTDLKA